MNGVPQGDAADVHPVPVVEVLSICKRFSGVRALSEVSLAVLPGEVHAVVGENGAGKSTLMLVLSGVYAPDAGQVLINGAVTRIADPAQAKQIGIGTVFQELSLVPGLSVAENIFAHALPTRWGVVDRRRLLELARDALTSLGVDVDPHVHVGRLPIAVRQLVEIAKALSHSKRLLILDEPTSSLTGTETQRLLEVVRSLRGGDLGVLFVSHKLSEVFQVADRITVMREGRVVDTLKASDTTPDQVVSLMVGRAIADRQEQPHTGESREVLRVESLIRIPHSRPVSLQVCSGEVVGLAGLKGSGRTELAQTLFGLIPAIGGSVYLEGRLCRFRNPSEAMAAGIGYLPEDRKEEGLFPEMSVWENIIASALPELTRHGMLNRRLARKHADAFRQSLRIRTPSLDQRVRNLSGGNQQKVLLSRWLLRNPKVLIVDEPTRGVDVGARAEIHNLIRELAGRGCAVLVISSELPELLSLADRLYVMADGSISGELAGTQMREEQVMVLATRAGTSGKDI